MSNTRRSHESFNFNNYVTKVYYCSFQGRINEVLNGKVHTVVKLQSWIQMQFSLKWYESHMPVSGWKSHTAHHTALQFPGHHKHCMIYWLRCDSPFMWTHLSFQMKPFGLWRQKPPQICFCIFTVLKLLSLRILKNRILGNLGKSSRKKDLIIL